MTSFRQIEANRRNAISSTGPKTEDGKRRSRHNAVRHGLTAETVVSPCPASLPIAFPGRKIRGSRSNREINREISSFSHPAAEGNVNPLAVQGTCAEIPRSTEQGNIGRLSGK